MNGKKIKLKLMMKISIEQYENLVELLKHALKFYADKSNYSGTIAPIDSDEHGSQARFALKKIEELKEINKNMEDELLKKYGSSNDDNIDSHDFSEIINEFKKEQGL